MHLLKNTIFLAFLLSVSLGLASCAGNATPRSSEDEGSYQRVQQEKQLLLENTFNKMQSLVAQGVSPEKLYPYITDSSRFWMDTLEVLAKTASKEILEQRPFCEILAVVTYRLYEREHLWKVPEDRMLSLVTGPNGVIQRAVNLKLGPFEVKNDRGSVGLATSSKVPIILFTWDDSSWKLDLVATMPLITKGLETIGVKKDWSNTKLVLYLLEKEYHYNYNNIDESLLEPVPAF